MLSGENRNFVFLNGWLITVGIVQVAGTPCSYLLTVIQVPLFVMSLVLIPLFEAITKEIYI